MKSDRLLTEAIEALGYDPDDYLKIANRFNSATLSYYMDLAFAIGYEQGYTEANLKGRCSRSKKIQSHNEFNLPSKPYKSIHEAAMSVQVNERNLRKALKKGNKCGGFYWKYA